MAIPRAEAAASTLESHASSDPTTRETESETRHGWKVLGVLSGLMAFSAISTDIYLPAMPTIARELHGGAGSVELTISSYLFGFASGQLLWGPLGDRFGRRQPVTVGLIFFTLGSVGCALATSVPMMIVWRVVQAVGASAAVALSRAMVRDLATGPRAAQMLSTLMIVLSIAPLLGPLLGGQIVTYLGWRAIFWLLVGIGVVTPLAVLTLPETLPPERRTSVSIARALRGYLELLGRREVLGYIGVGGFFYAGLFAYIAGTPSAYIDYFGVGEQLYGLLFGAGALGMMISNAWNTRIVGRLSKNATSLRSNMAVAAIFSAVISRQKRSTAKIQSERSSPVNHQIITLVTKNLVLERLNFQS